MPCNAIARYIVASPTAKYNEPQTMFDTPADVVFLCSAPNELTEAAAEALVASGCQTVVDGAYRPVSSPAAEVRGSACLCLPLSTPPVLFSFRMRCGCMHAWHP